MNNFRSDEIRALETQVHELEDSMGDVKKHISSAVHKSEIVSKEALGLLVLEISLPPVNLTELRNRVDALNQEAEEIKTRAQGMINQNIELIEEMEEQIKNSEKVLQQAQIQTDRTAELLAEVDEANKIATDAVARSAKTLEEAKNTLAKLEGNEVRKGLETIEIIDEEINLVFFQNLTI